MLQRALMHDDVSGQAQQAAGEYQIQLLRYLHLGIGWQENFMMVALHCQLQAPLRLAQQTPIDLQLTSPQEPAPLQCGAIAAGGQLQLKLLQLGGVAQQGKVPIGQPQLTPGLGLVQRALQAQVTVQIPFQRRHGRHQRCQRFQLHAIDYQRTRQWQGALRGQVQRQIYYP